MAMAGSSHSIPEIHRNDSHRPSGTKPSSLKWNYDAYGIAIDDHGSSSPYYRGLTDQSLAIYEHASCPAFPQTQTQTHTLLYYLVSTSSGGSSPYYKGLTDNSLALYGGLRTDPPSAFHNCVSAKNLSFWLKRKDVIVKKLNVLGQSSSSSSGPKSSKIMTECDGKEAKRKEVTEEKAVTTRLSEKSSKVDAKVFEEITGKEKVSEEYGLVGKKEKCSREITSVTEKRDVPQSLCNDGREINQEIMLKVIVEKEKEEEYVWADKYQPKALEDFICNREKAIQLQALVRHGCGCNHLIFEGPPGVGKRSMIRAMLREVFGPLEITEEIQTFNLKGETLGSIQVPIRKSPHHVEVNLSDTKEYEKYVIADLFKETYDRIINKSLPCSPDNCQAIIIYEAERLPKESLFYIKWLMERYKEGCSKIFFCCSNDSKLQLVKALCATVQLSPPSSKEIVEILELIAEREGIKLSTNFAAKIVENSNYNLRQAIRSLEATYRNKLALEADQAICTGWEEVIINIAKNIIEEQSLNQLFIIRRTLQSLMMHNVPPDFVYKSLVVALTSLVDESLRSEVDKIVDKEYNAETQNLKVDEIKSESVMQFGEAEEKVGELKNKELTKKNIARSYQKVEEFIAIFMSWYKKSPGKSTEHVQLETSMEVTS